MRKSEVCSVRFTKSDLDVLERIAQEREASVGSVVRWAVKLGLNTQVSTNRNSGAPSVEVDRTAVSVVQP